MHGSTRRNFLWGGALIEVSGDPPRGLRGEGAGEWHTVLLDKTEATNSQPPKNID